MIQLIKTFELLFLCCRLTHKWFSLLFPVLACCSYGIQNVQKIFHSLSELASTLYRNMRWGGYQASAGVQIASCWMCSALNGVWTVLFRTL